MNTTESNVNCYELRGKLKRSFTKLTEHDLVFEQGREDHLYGQIQQRLGKTKEEVKKLFLDL